MDGLLERVGIAAYADERADSIPTGTARLLELARCLAGDPQLLLLDEPSSGQDETETDAFGELLRDLASEGRGILMVEHDMDLVMAVCDVIHVLDFGAVIASGAPADIRNDPAVQKAYLGYSDESDGEHVGARADLDETRTDLQPVDATITIPAVTGMSVPILEVVDVHAAYGRIEVLRGVDLSVPKGAVMALLGPNGAGKSTLTKIISGQKKPTSGDVHLGGVNVKDAKPEELARVGLCTIPEGRSVFPNLTVEENLTADVVRRRRGPGRPGHGVLLLPAAARAPRPARRHPVRRRAADARHVPGARLRPGAADPRRAVDGARAADRRRPLRDRRPDRGRAASRSCASSSSPAPRSASPTTRP